jgi:rRNA biogenesis protein RRP5
MKILGQVVSIIPLGLIISLPNQLYGHVPITQISSQFTSVLERFDNQGEYSDEDDTMEDEEEGSQILDLFEMFRVGQYVRAVVTNVHAAGVSDMMGVGKLRDDLAKASRRMELSLVPEKVNVGVQKTDLKSGFVSPYLPLVSLLKQLLLDYICFSKRTRRSRLQP